MKPSEDTNWDANADGRWLEKVWNRHTELRSPGGVVVAAPRDAMPSQMAVVAPAVGAGALFLLLPGKSTWVKYVGFSGKPWHLTGNCPVVWSLSNLPRWKRACITVMASPDVALSRVNTDRIFGPEPKILIYRSSSTDNLPDPDTPLVASELIGSCKKLLNGADPLAVDPSAEESEALRHVITEDPITVRPGFNSVAILQENGQWSITIENTNPLNRGGFVYEVLPVRKDKELEERARQKGITVPAWFLYFIEVRIVYAGNSVEIAVERTETPRALQDIISFFHLDVESIGESAKWGIDSWVVRSARLIVTAGKVDVGSLPQQGDPLPEDLPLFEKKEKTPLAYYGPYLESVIGFIPVVGTVMDTLHLIYMVMYQTSFWGQPVSQGEIIAQALFTMLGVVGDAADAARLVGMELRLFGSAPREAAPEVKIFKSNPGWPPWLKAMLTAVIDPQTLDVVERNRKQAVDQLEAYVNGDISEKELLDAFQTLVTAEVKVLAETGVISDRLAQSALKAMSPAELEFFDDLDPRQQAKVFSLWDEATGTAPMPYEDFVAKLAEVAKPMAESFEGGFLRWRVTSVMTADGTSFRHKELTTMYARYLAKPGKSKNAVQWAANQTSGRAYDLLRTMIGPNFQEVLKHSEAYFEVTPAALQLLKSLPLSRYCNTYERVRESTKGLGQWFQVDHILEQRFIYKVPELVELVDRAMTPSFLVPLNKWISRQLPDELLNFPYVHSEKTAAMNRLIPKGTESEFCLVEVFSAHLIVMRGQFATGSLQFPSGDVFDGTLKAHMMEIAEELVKADGATAANRLLGSNDLMTSAEEWLLAEFESQLEAALARSTQELMLLNPRFGSK